MFDMNNPFASLMQYARNAPYSQGLLRQLQTMQQMPQVSRPPPAAGPNGLISPAAMAAYRGGAGTAGTGGTDNRDVLARMLMSQMMGAHQGRLSRGGMYGPSGGYGNRSGYTTSASGPS